MCIVQHFGFDSSWMYYIYLCYGKWKSCVWSPPSFLVSKSVTILLVPGDMSRLGTLISYHGNLATVAPKAHSFT